MQFTKGIKNARAILIIIFVFLMSLGLVELAGYYSSDRRAPTNGRSKLKKRFEYLLKSWPEITKNPNQTNLFVGTSVFQYFLDPRVYDEELAKYGISMKSYNMSFQGNIGIGLRSYMYRLKSECEKNNIVFDSVFFEIIPSAESKKFYKSHRNMIDIGNPEVFMDSDTWTKLFLTDPISAAYLYFVNQMRPLDWNNLVSSFLASKKFHPRIARFAGIANFWSLPQFYEKPEWNIETVGMVNWNRSASSSEFDETMRFVHTPDQWNIFLKEYINGNTVSKDFAYEENLIDFYVQSINIAKTFAKNIYIVKLPTAPTFQALVDQYVNEDYMLNKVYKETGVKIIDYTRIGSFTDNDFADPMHLRHETMNFYIKNLAKDIAVIKKSGTVFK
jgi:hypothetical protein